MSLYYRNLKRIGLLTVLISLGNLVYETLIRQYLLRTGSAYAAYIPQPWGIWAKNLIGMTAGAAALLFYLKKRHYTFGTLLLAFLCAAEAVVILWSIDSSAGTKANGIIDITMLVMILLTYTLSQTDRDLKRWNSVRARDPVMLDLRLADKEAFFNPVQVGPSMAINLSYAQVISRFIESMRTAAPLQINLLCASPVAPTIRDMMRDVLQMHFETEENSLLKDLEKRYRRILRLTAVSIFVIGLTRQTSLLTNEMVLWDIVGNFAAFGLWQIGYTHYERNEDYEKLLNVHIAKHASLHFVDR